MKKTNKQKKQKKFIFSNMGLLLENMFHLPRRQFAKQIFLIWKMNEYIMYKYSCEKLDFTRDFLFLLFPKHFN